MAIPIFEANNYTFAGVLSHEHAQCGMWVKLHDKVAAILLRTGRS